MFRNSTNKPDMKALSDFIEKPSQNCTEEDFSTGIPAVLVVLDKNPTDLFIIISAHPFIAANYLFCDLVKKMRNMECVEKLNSLLITCFDELIDACVYNEYDLKRLLAAVPDYLDRIMEKLLSSSSLMQRLFQNSQDPEEFIEEIGEKYPLYQESLNSSLALIQHTLG